MDQPLGRAVGNALEVAEAVATLRGEGPADLAELCRHEAGALLALAGAAPDAAEGERLADAAVRDGSALATFAACVAAQGGDARQVERPDRLPAAPVVAEVASPRAGWVAGIDALQIGRLTMRLGGGRSAKATRSTTASACILHAKVGDRLAAGDPLVAIHAARPADAEAIRADLLAAYAWSDAPVAAPPLLLGEVG